MFCLNAVLPLLFLCCSAFTLSLGDGDVLVNLNDIEEKEEKEEADDVEKDGKSDTSRGQKLGGRDPGLIEDGGPILGRNFVMEFPMARPAASWGRQFTTLVHRNLLVYLSNKFSLS
jgi:hypothetical protein